MSLISARLASSVARRLPNAASQVYYHITFNNLLKDLECKTVNRNIPVIMLDHFDKVDINFVDSKKNVIDHSIINVNILSELHFNTF